MTGTTAARTGRTLTVGQVADATGVTVRTLHHYDEIGLLRPSDRSPSGYRLYTSADVERLARVVGLRRLGLSLEDVADALDAGPARRAQVLRRHRAVVAARLDELAGALAALDTALEAEMTRSTPGLTPDEQREIFGDGFRDEYAAEAQERWGDTDAWKQSAARTARYTKQDWEQVKAEADAVGAAFVVAMQSGAPASSSVAMDAAEAHRRHIHERFYDVSYDMHRGLADMYVADERFTKTYEDVAPGLAQYVRDAIHANADRHA